MKFTRSLLMFLFLGLPILSISCSTTDGQEEIQQEEIIQEDGEEGEQGENSDNEENEQGEDNTENGGFTNEANNQFFNNEGNAGGLNAGAQGQGEGELQQIMEDMNGANANQFGQEGGANGMMQQDPMQQDPMAQQNMGDMMGQDQMQNAPMDQVSQATAGSPLAPGLPELGSKMSYIVQKGDTLARIASKVYGEPSKWTEIADFTGIANPRLIYPGDVVYYQLTEQTMAFASNYESVKRSEVTVEAGDTLSTIASRVLGNAGNWKLIWRLNDTIANPDRLVAGSVIYYVDPGSMSSELEDSIGSFAEMSTMPSIDSNTDTQSEIVDEFSIDNSDLSRVVEMSFSLENDFARNSGTDSVQVI